VSIGKAKANPTKAFFVRMLTRDISLDDCILDLVDNSIDGAWELAGAEPWIFERDRALQGYRVDIAVSPEKFTISDNCGGITFDNAVEYAFTFGNDGVSDPGHAYSVGVYGIGMKRALFKLGEEIVIRSTFESSQDGGDETSFKVPINVIDWLRRGGIEDWDFEIDDDEPLSSPGVNIEVSSLSEETKRRFGDPTYAASLRRVLATDYLLPLRRELTITVNDKPVDPASVPLREGGDFAPMRDVRQDGPVRIEIFAGMSSPPPDDPSAADESDRRKDASGWYVFCNGRCVVGPDTTTLTGWGMGNVPKWHGQYSGFIGLVSFSSKDTLSLPMTTTKRNVDVSSNVYARTLAAMSEPARAWTAYTNTRKHQTDAAKVIEANSKPVDLSDVKSSRTVKLPVLKKHPIPVANVNYAVPLKKLRAVSEALGDITMNYRDVGLGTFEYTYENIVSDGEE
jgi:hypothetical protein